MASPTQIAVNIGDNVANVRDEITGTSDSQPLGKYQGFIYLGVAVGTYALASTRAALPIVVLLSVILVYEIRRGIVDKVTG